MVMEASDKALDVLDPLIVDLDAQANPGKRRKAADVLGDEVRRSHKGDKKMDAKRVAGDKQMDAKRVASGLQAPVHVKVEQHGKQDSKRVRDHDSESDRDTSDSDVAEMREAVQRMLMPRSRVATAAAA